MSTKALLPALGAARSQRVLPGFGLSLGISLMFVSLVLLLPLTGLFGQLTGLSLADYWAIVTDGRVMASYMVTIGAAAVAALVNGAFGLLLACAVGLFGRTRLWQGLLWGLGGFLAFAALPALGLPPKLPGMEAGPLVERQLWWVATAAASVAGLGLLAFARPLWLRPLGLVLLALPHIVGAPLGSGESAVPPELAQRFVIASLATAALFWLALGLAVTQVYRRLDRA